MYELSTLQHEYHLILQSLDSAIITTSDTHIKYFNQAGQKLLKDSLVKNTQGLPGMQCLHELTTLQQQIAHKKSTKTTDDKRQERQDKILSQACFKIYIKNQKKVAAEDQGRFSYKDLMQMDNGELSKIVFQKLSHEEAVSDGNSKDIYFTVDVKKLSINNQTFCCLRSTTQRSESTST